jgi:hypothetical protein
MSPHGFVRTGFGDLSEEVGPKFGRRGVVADCRLPRRCGEAIRWFIQPRNARSVRVGKSNEFIIIRAESFLRDQRHWEVIGETANGGGIRS